MLSLETDGLPAEIWTENCRGGATIHPYNKNVPTVYQKKGSLGISALVPVLAGPVQTRPMFFLALPGDQHQIGIILQMLEAVEPGAWEDHP